MDPEIQTTNDSFISEIDELLLILVEEYNKFKQLRTKLNISLYSRQFTWIKQNEKIYVFCKYGTKIHEELQNLIELRKEDDGIPLYSDYQEVENYFKFVEPIYSIEPVMTEKIVVLYNDQGEPCAAGRFDLLCKVKGELTLADFKTTSTIHRQLVTGQLNLYLKAAEQSGYLSPQDNVKLGVIHLSGATSRYVPIAKLGDNFIKKFY